MRAKVGALPQKGGPPHALTPARGRNARAHAQSGMSLETLKRQTAYRLAQESGPDGEGDDDCSANAEGAAAIAVAIASASASASAAFTTGPAPAPAVSSPPYPQPAPHLVMHPPHAAAPYPLQPGRDYPPSHGYGDIPANYSHESRNYTDSQLGVGGAGGGPAPPLLAPPPPLGPPPAYRPAPAPAQAPPYSTPRMPRRATVLKDRGNSENSGGPAPAGGGPDGGGGGRGHGWPRGGGAAKPSPAALKGPRGAGGRPARAGAGAATAPGKPPGQELPLRSPDGRHTPVRDPPLEGQVLFATPNQRQVPTTPTSIYSEPPRSRTGHRAHHQNMSPNYTRILSPDHHPGNYAKGGGGGYFNKHQLSKHQSKLPHGLTVQELKEMTRARLAAEAELGGPEGSSDHSVHSAGTHTSSKGSDPFSLGLSGSALSNESMTRNLVQSNDSLRREYPSQRRNCPPFAHGQSQPLPPMPPPNPPPYGYPRPPSPVFDPGPPAHQFDGGTRRPPRQTSPAFALGASQTRSQGEAWDAASAAPGTPAPDYLDSVLPFSTPLRGAPAARGNRGRCFSAGANARPSLDRHPAAYYDGVPLSGGADREHGGGPTGSPPGMSRLHEDRPFPFAPGARGRLALPALGGARRRLHSAGALAAPAGGGSAFVPIGRGGEGFRPPSPRPLSVDRTRFNAADRALSNGSAGHGDLPSSMAEAVLESITSTAGAPIGGALLDASPFRSTEQEMLGASPFRGMPTESSENASSAFRLDTLLTDSQGSMSLFSNRESRNLFPSDNGGGRMLLGTHSWGGAEHDAVHANVGINHDFGNLLNLSSGNLSPLRGRAATEPNWFGGGNDDPLFVSRIDPEHNGASEAPPRLRLADRSAPNGHPGSNFNGGFK